MSRAGGIDCREAVLGPRISETVARLAPKAPRLALPVLRSGVSAFFHARCLGAARRDVLTIIDFTLPSSARRLWVFDVTQAALLFHERVAHGRGSGMATATRFSDLPESRESSLGLFVTGATYQGKHGYSLLLDGLEPGINAHARARGIVVHAAEYMTERFVEAHGRAGRSYGCPALDPRVSKPIIEAIKDGSVLWSYFPTRHPLATSPAPAQD